MDVPELSAEGYYQQLLRLAYRLIFLFCVEERGLLHQADNSMEAIAARQAYAEGYSQSRLRTFCLKRRARNRFDDQWQAVRIVFRGLAAGEPRLALPALSGLFAPDQCVWLDAAGLDNAHFMAAMENLRWATVGNAKVPVDYRNMGPEELGSVYESLLELVPEVELSTRRFAFIGQAAGNARKLTGSYYTPDALVRELIKSALDPVIAARLAENPADPIAALLAIRVIDPACGSGHFLLAAARRLAEKLAQLRAEAAGEDAVKPAGYRHALREVVAHCIFGVDKNPLALELARMALWLEGFEEGRPLFFFDHHLRCGDALLGMLDLGALDRGIAKDAYKPLSGDDKEAAKALSKRNAKILPDFLLKSRSDFKDLLTHIPDDESKHLCRIESMPEDTVQETAAKEAQFSSYRQEVDGKPPAQASDVAVGAYLLPKVQAADIAIGTYLLSKHPDSNIPTTRTLYLIRKNEALPETEQRALEAARRACVEARVLHWPLAFPQVFAAGGFDCVLSNPPWERIKLQEEEFFAARHPSIANAKNKAERGRLIAALAQGDEADKRLYDNFIITKRAAEAATAFVHVKGEDGGRFPLTGVGDVNTYALFAETISQIVHPEGRAGFIVPTGIATDDSTRTFFADITQRGRLVSLYDIENRDKLFPAVDSRMKFCLLTLGAAERAEFVCFATQVSQLADPRRRFSLTPEGFRLINPNTRTCPVFRSERDAELTKKIYRAAPVLMRDAVIEGKGKQAKVVEPAQNPWGISFMAMLHMANDSHLFHDTPDDGLLPLYEAKLIHHFDHRWATYTPDSKTRNISPEEKRDPEFFVKPRYWVDAAEVKERLNDKDWHRRWLMGWRDITNATNERTVIASVVPRVGVGHKMPLFLFKSSLNIKQMAAFYGNLCALVFDYIARQKVGGTSLTYHYIKQFPILPPNRYADADLAFILPRVLELTYTAHDLKAWAEDLGYDGPPFVFDPERRAVLRAELDAYYARLYGLARDELRYILDPADVMGKDYPSETFRVLKNKEIAEFGEYRTRRLVLHEFDRMTLAEAGDQPYESQLIPPPGQQPEPVYARFGIPHSPEEARWLGILLFALRQAGSLPRMEADLLFAFMKHETFDIEVGLSPTLQYFAREGVIRFRDGHDTIDAIADAPLPNGITPAADAEAQAARFLRMMKEHLATQSALAEKSKAVQTAANPAKRA